MANTAQAKKRARQGEKRRQHNASLRSMMRTTLKRVLKAITEGKSEQALKEYRSMSSAVDRLAAKKLIHQNKANRHKSRLSNHLKALLKKSA